MKKHLPFLFVILFSSTLLLQLVFEQILLTDDLARVKEGEGYAYFGEFITDFLNTDTMSSRPISGIFYAPSIYMIKYLGLNVYYINYIYYLISLILIYKVLSVFFHRNMAVVGVFIYSLLPLATSVIFSPIMMNSNLATSFYCLSLLLIYKYNEEKRRTWFIFSIICYWLSILSYEIFIPCIIINAYLLSAKILDRIIYIFSILLLTFIYRHFLEPYLFSNYFHRSSSENILNFSRNFKIIKEIFFIFLAKLPKSIIRGILAIRYYSVYDFILWGVSIIFSFFLVYRVKWNYKISKKYLVLFIIAFLCSFVIFCVSGYYPSIYDFDNRNLGAVRFFIVFIFCNILLIFPSKNIKWIKFCLFSFFIVFITNIISIKNAWIYAYNFNRELFIEIKKNIPQYSKTFNIRNHL